MQNKTLYRDMIPYRAGIVRITPLDSNFSPLYDQVYTTGRDFLTSTQRSTTLSYDTFFNSNGDASDYITQRRENLTLTTQIYDPRFDAIISGKELVKSTIQSIKDIEILLPAGSAYYIFQNESYYPVESSDGKIHLEIRDPAGIKYDEVNSAPSSNQYKYTQNKHTIEFSKENYDRILSCVYYVETPIQEAYNPDPLLGNSVFMIEAFGEMQSASNGIKQSCYTCIKRATFSGELNGVKRQKSINNEISYTFVSAPFKRGDSVCTELFSAIE